MTNIASFDLDAIAHRLNSTASYSERGPTVRLARNAMVSASGDFGGKTLTTSGIAPQDLAPDRKVSLTAQLNPSDCIPANGWLRMRLAHASHQHPHIAPPVERPRIDAVVQLFSRAAAHEADLTITISNSVI